MMKGLKSSRIKKIQELLAVTRHDAFQDSVCIYA